MNKRGRYCLGGLVLAQRTDDFIILWYEHKLIRTNKEVRTNQYNTVEGALESNGLVRENFSEDVILAMRCDRKSAVKWGNKGEGVTEQRINF